MASNHDYPLQRPVKELLALFGAGKPTPGVGSAAAWVGLISASMVITGCKLAVGKGKHVFERTADEARAIESRLQPLFQADCEAFGKVIEARHALKKADSTTAKRQVERHLLLCEAEATNTALEISDECLGLIDLAAQVSEGGYRAAAAETIGAARLAIAGAETALSAARLNMSNDRASKLMRQRRQLDKIAKRLEEAKEQFQDLSTTKRLSPTKLQRMRQIEFAKQIRFLADRLPGNARRHVRNRARQFGTRIASLAPDDAEVVMSDLDARFKIEQRLVHNRLAVDQIDSLFDDVIARRGHNG